MERVWRAAQLLGATEEKKAQVRGWQTVVDELSRGIIAGASAENAEEYQYAMEEDRISAQRKSVRALETRFVGSHSPLRSMDTPITAATVGKRLSEILGTAHPGSSYSQRDIFRPAPEDDPGEKERRRSRQIEEQGDFWEKHPAALEMHRLRLQLSTYFDRQQNRYILFVSSLRTAVRNTDTSDPATFLESQVYARKPLFAAIFNNPEDLTDDMQLFVLDDDEGRKASAQIVVAQNPGDLESKFIAALGIGKFPDTSVLGESSEDFVHHMFV